VHCEDNFMNHQAVVEVMKSIMRLDSLEVFANQQMYELGDTLPDELPLAISKKKINLTTGIWINVEEIDEWPNGVACIQMCANTGGHVGLANILEAFTDLAENTLETTMGRVRCLLGMPLTRDTMRFTTHDVTGFSATKVSSLYRSRLFHSYLMSLEYRGTMPTTSAPRKLSSVVLLRTETL
jgi:hypothetical protein